MKITELNSTGSFISNPNPEVLATVDRSCEFAQITFAVSTVKNHPLYNVKVKEYFNDKTIKTDNPDYVPAPPIDFSDMEWFRSNYTAGNDNQMYLYARESGPLQTEINITIPHIDQNLAKVNLDKLVEHLSKGFYTYNPYVYVMQPDYYNPIATLKISAMSRLLEDSIWQGLRSSTIPGLEFPDELIDLLKGHTYPHVLIASEAAIYAEIQNHIQAKEYEQAVTCAITVGNAKDNNGWYVSSKAEYLYQTGRWLEKAGSEARPFALRAYRALKENDAHCLQYLAGKRIAKLSTAKLKDRSTDPDMTVAWNLSRINALGLQGAVANEDGAQDDFLDSFFIAATNNYAVAETAPGAEYSVALENELAKLKQVKFKDDSGISLGFAMLGALLKSAPTQKTNKSEEEEDVANTTAKKLSPDL